MNKIELLYIDLFCGPGGSSSGVEYATVDGNVGEMMMKMGRGEEALNAMFDAKLKG